MSSTAKTLPRTIACLWLLVTFLMARMTLAQSVDGTPEEVQQRDAQLLLERYVKTALEQSPSLLALRQRHESARAMVAPSGALPDPMVGIMYQSVGAPWQPMGPMSMVQGEISQSIPGVGKRQARRNVAQADADVRRAEIEATKHRIAAEVRSLFAQIYALDRERQALESAGELIQAMAAATAGQFISGRADQEALAKTEFERSKLREQLVDLGASREVLSARLNRLSAKRESEVVPMLAALPEIKFDQLAEAQQLGDATSPELRLQRSLIVAASRRHESAELETRPNFLVGLSGGATTSGEPVVVLRFGMELPIWRSTKQDPMARAAQSDLEASESERIAMELKLGSEKAELIARFKRDREQIQLYRHAVIPSAALALKAAQDSYATGRTSFATVIADYRIWLESAVGLARREAERLMTWAELQAILGKQH